MDQESRQAQIRRWYRIKRVECDLSQLDVEIAARKHFPEFASGAFRRIEHAIDFPTPSELRALAAVFGIDESEFPKPTPPAEDASSPSEHSAVA